MSRRVIEWCVLAYPRSRRDDDGEYLRDLALELGETHGLRRQAWSLLTGGIGERWRLRRDRGMRANARLAGGLLATAALLICAVAVFGTTETEVEVQSCVGSSAPTCQHA